MKDWEIDANKRFIRWWKNWVIEWNAHPDAVPEDLWDYLPHITIEQRLDG